MHLTGLIPKYLGLESVNFPVIVSIDVLISIPLASPVYRYNYEPYFSWSSSVENYICSMTTDSMCYFIFWVDRIFKQDSGFN